MKKFDYDTFNKRYDKFKSNNLPTPFFDEERQTLEYVSFDPKLNVSDNLGYALEHMSYTGLYYPYHIKDYARLEMESKMKLQFFHSHNHDFESVIRDLYMHPESFEIMDDEKEFYSKQELNYLSRIKAFLNLIELKDIYKGKKNRYNNILYNKYKDSGIMKFDNDVVELMINKKINYIPYLKRSDYDITNNTYLVLIEIMNLNYILK